MSRRVTLPRGPGAAGTAPFDSVRKVRMPSLLCKKRYLPVALVVYIVSGFLQPTVVDYLRLRRSVGHPWLLMPTLCNVVGMLLCFTLAERASIVRTLRLLRESPPLRRSVAAGSMVDLCSGMLLTAGLLRTGSGVFAVLYNSVPAFTAVLSRVFLGRHLSLGQVAGVIMVCTGLAMNVLGSHLHLQGSESSSTVLLGSVAVLCGSVLHSGMFVLSESKVAGDHASLPPLLWCAALGCLETIFMGTWVGIGTWCWGFSVEGESMDERPATAAAAAVGFAALVAVDLAHAASFFALLSELGAVGAALLKGLQTCAIFIASGLLFCSEEEAACLTRLKMASIGVVLAGTTLYASASRQAKSAADDSPSPEDDARNKVIVHSAPIIV